MPIPQLTDSPKNNEVLSVLSHSELKKITPELEYVEFEPQEVLWEIDQKGAYVYFPTSCLISLQYENETGTSVSIASLGRSGVVGAGLVGSNIRTPDRAVVIFGGSGYRLKASRADNELAECGEFHALLLAYTQNLIVHLSQNAICNRLHRIDQQLARWLLACSDDLQSDSLAITHEQMAAVLGVRRESVSLAASDLQRRKVVKTGRARVLILDREKLADAACECYAIVRDHLSQTLKKFDADHAP